MATDGEMATEAAPLAARLEVSVGGLIIGDSDIDLAGEFHQCCVRAFEARGRARGLSAAALLPSPRCQYPLRPLGAPTSHNGLVDTQHTVVRHPSLAFSPVCTYLL